ncbi:hypothetical protein [Niabella ginsengisoli]|uniref:Aspartate/homoserine dehydrogenase NAD-binding domain-containing protein n=1 Tax=Niabella ginsengisoli TaxID=522298 RepID=A0ABS9SFY1_9BACT|nr:hypothetical protein [Niabella ginsengisoli]MCH5597268.1 hypothetical protein [Niabella ginsengisoli]
MYQKSAEKRNAPAELFTTDRDELLEDKDINVIVEVIDDANAAFEIVKTALNNKKEVVSSSKKMVAEHLQELLDMQQKTGRSFCMNRRRVHLFRQSEIWKNIMTMICCIASGRL